MAIMRLIVTLSAAAVTAAGCAHLQTEMDYQAVGTTEGMAEGGTQEGPATASYPIPGKDAKGRFHVVSLGGETLAVAQGPSFYLHVRVAAENEGDANPWTVGAHEQSLSIGGGQPALPAFAQSSAGGPTLTVAPGARGFLDLYFALPDQVFPPTTALSWQLHRGDEVIAQTTEFLHASGADPQHPYYRPVYRQGITMAFGPTWWWYGDYWGGYGGFGPWWYRPYGYYPYYPRYYSGFGNRGYYGGRYFAPAPRGGGGNFWRGSAPSAAPRSGGGSSGRGGWRGGRR